DARQVEQGAGRRGGHTVLARSGFGDDPGLAKPAGQERLTEGVVDLVRAGVGEVLTLQVEAQARDRRVARTARSAAQPRGLVANGSGQPIRSVQSRWSPGKVRQQ